ncbi:dynein regulatory complex subunit 3 isoform X2 [Ascaphus truei]|uniref:dynein regulatory complex subunit 3 isoform X2 n=1 Tax=Ascaphus truei TaxID=8439 RepID=UPI003F5ADCF3
MSRLYDTIEPNVINDEMLKKMVEEQGPKEEAGRIAKLEGIDFKDVTSLHLDFKNILKIDNLWQFQELTKLQLDNNIIEKIEGLDTLVHLVWLDLSFNNIEEIGGLDALTKLEDLSLHNNRISVIENMDRLKNLHVLSLGNNNLTSLENIMYLRNFKQLQALNLAGNPLSEAELYKMFIAAHLPGLVYLDFRLIDENLRDIAYVKYQYSIEEQTQNESLARHKQEKDEQMQRELDSHQVAYVEHLNGPFLFESLYTEDADGTTLSSLPAVAEIVDEYRSNCVTICQSVFEYGLVHHKKREAEMSTFNECLLEAMRENQEEGARQTQAFEDKNDEFFYELPQNTDLQNQDAKMFQYNEDISQLMDSLLTLELQLVEQLELFVDKDTIVNAVNASHDIHLLKIDNREDELVTKINSWATNLIQKVHRDEMQRNRKRVAEITSYIDHVRDELDNMEVHEQL